MVSKCEVLKFDTPHTFNSSIRHICELLDPNTITLGLSVTYITDISSVKYGMIKCFKIEYCNKKMFVTFPDSFIKQCFDVNMRKYTRYTLHVTLKENIDIKSRLTEKYAGEEISIYDTILYNLEDLMDSDSITVRIVFDNKNMAFLYKNKKYLIDKEVYKKVRKMINSTDKKYLHLNRIEVDNKYYLSIT